MTNKWPRIDYLSWRETCSALHLYLQIAGKYRLAHSPRLHHSWHSTFYVTPRGLTTSPIPDGPGVELRFDLHDHVVSGIDCRQGMRHPGFYNTGTLDNYIQFRRNQCHRIFRDPHDPFCCGIIDLVGAGLDFFVGADGVLSLEFYEGFDDAAGVIDGEWNQGVLTVVWVPAPGAAAVLGLGGLMAVRRRR